MVIAEPPAAIVLLAAPHRPCSPPEMLMKRPNPTSAIAAVMRQYSAKSCPRSFLRKPFHLGNILSTTRVNSSGTRALVTRFSLVMSRKVFLYSVDNALEDHAYIYSGPRRSDLGIAAPDPSSFSERSSPESLLENSKAALMLSGLLPSDGHDRDVLTRKLLAGRYSEIRMLYFLGKDAFRWIGQCMEIAERTPEMGEAELKGESFAGY